MAIIRELNIPNKESLTFCSAVRLISRTNGFSLSCNSEEYWCWSDTNIFGIHIKIKKDSKEGKEITKCIADNPKDTDVDLLQKVIDSIIVSNMSDVDIVDTFRYYNKSSYNDGYEKGQRDKVNDFKNLLGI